MSTALVAFWAFLVLTVLFAVTMLWRLIPRPAVIKPDLSLHTMALATLAPSGPDAESVKTIADAIGSILKALADFGSKIDTLGPTALLGIFTIIFALLTVTCAWLSRS